MNDLRNDPDIDPDALVDDAPLWLSAQEAALVERSFLRQWQPVPPGVKPWGRTVMHTPDGCTYTNVAPPEPPAPDLRTVGDRVQALEASLAAVQKELEAQLWIMTKVADNVRNLEVVLHRLLNPGEQEGGE